MARKIKIFIQNPKKQDLSKKKIYIRQKTPKRGLRLFTQKK